MKTSKDDGPKSPFAAHAELRPLLSFKVPPPDTPPSKGGEAETHLPLQGWLRENRWGTGAGAGGLLVFVFAALAEMPQHRAVALAVSPGYPVALLGEPAFQGLQGFQLPFPDLHAFAASPLGGGGPLALARWPLGGGWLFFLFAKVPSPSRALLLTFATLPLGGGRLLFALAKSPSRSRCRRRRYRRHRLFLALPTATAPGHCRLLLQDLFRVLLGAGFPQLFVLAAPPAPARRVAVGRKTAQGKTLLAGSQGVDREDL